MSIIEVPATKDCQCNMCGAKKPVDSDRAWPFMWAEVRIRENPSTADTTRHVCDKCRDRFNKLFQ